MRQIYRPYRSTRAGPWQSIVNRAVATSAALTAGTACPFMLAAGVILAAPAHADCDPDYAVTQANAACYCNQHQWPSDYFYQQCIQSELKELQMMHDVCRQKFGPDADLRDGRCQSAHTTQPSQVPATTPVQAPNNLPTVPTHAPTTKPALVRPPRGLDASRQAIAAAKAAPPARVDPGNPPAAPTQADFNQRVQNVISNQHAHIDVVNGLAHPCHWDYIDYDQDRHPVLYNPLNDAMTFRYFYAGSYREVYVAAGSSVVLNVAVGGLYPFTAVGETYLTSGSFYGGWPSPLYHAVTAYIPAHDQTVQIGTVQQVGHDDTQPIGGQDTFMLDDSTLAWGQASNPTDGGQITVTKTQTLPGVGPTDDGKSLVDLAVPSRPSSAKAPWLIGAGVALVLAAGAAVLWGRRRRARTVET